MKQNEAPKIIISDLTLGYRREEILIHKLSTKIYSGMTLLEGRNGSGKSTLLLAIAGQLEPIGGEIHISGQPIVSHKARTLRTLVTSKPALISSLTLRDHVELSRIATGMSQRYILNRLEKYSLTAWLETPCGELSSGNQQRAWWAISTLSPRQVILVDEPFTAVDFDGIQEMIEELNQWSQEGHAVLIVAHEPPAGLSITDTITIRKEREI